MNVCSLQLDLRKCLDFTEKLFGGVTEAGEAILIGGVYLYNVFVASRDGYAFLHCMLTYVAGQLVYLLALETFSIAEADHEVFYDLEILCELVSWLQTQSCELFPYETTENVKDYVEFAEIYHRIPHSNEQRNNQVR